MSKCANCGSAITCGCQKRVLSDGTQGCTNCVGKVAGVSKPSLQTNTQLKTTTPTIEGKAPIS